jgi:two-component system, sensor histidine kinase and response regulator
VLVVDDNATNRLLLERLLARWNAVCEAVTGGHEALASLETAAAAGRSWAVVLLDMQMPDPDGIQTARAIRARPVLAGSRLVMLTSWARQPLEADALAADVALCLPKPVRASRLLDALRGAERAPVAPARPVATSGAPGAPAGTIRVLVADDNAVNQTVMRRMLDKRGCRVVVVIDGTEAVREVRGAHDDLVFMDCHMPVMDGFEATRVLRADGCRVPIIAFTADAVADNRERCVAAGMDDCMTKPVSAAGWTTPGCAGPRWAPPARGEPRLWYTAVP